MKRLIVMAALVMAAAGCRIQFGEPEPPQWAQLIDNVFDDIKDILENH